MFSEMTEKELEQMLQSLWWEHAHRRIEPTAAWRQWLTSQPTIQACDRACHGGLSAGCRGGCGLRDVRFLLRTTPVTVVRSTLKKKEVPDLPF
jgi:hypothetical protein